MIQIVSLGIRMGLPNKRSKYNSNVWFLSAKRLRLIERLSLKNDFRNSNENWLGVKISKETMVWVVL